MYIYGYIDTYVNICLTFDSAITLLEFYPKKIILKIQEAIPTRIFITALFIIAKNWEQPKYLYNREVG